MLTQSSCEIWRFPSDNTGRPSRKEAACLLVRPYPQLSTIWCHVPYISAFRLKFSHPQILCYAKRQVTFIFHLWTRGPEKPPKSWCTQYYQKHGNRVGRFLSITNLPVKCAYKDAPLTNISPHAQNPVTRLPVDVIYLQRPASVAETL